MIRNLWRILKKQKRWRKIDFVNYACEARSCIEFVMDKYGLSKDDAKNVVDNLLLR